MNIENEGIKICDSCMTPNNESSISCENCEQSLYKPSTLDPIGAIQGEGALLRKVMTRRPTFVVLLGIWILFIPWLIAGSAIMIMEIQYGKEFFDFFIFWCGVGFLYAGLKILFVVTRNYFTMAKPNQKVKTIAKVAESI